MGSLGCDTCGHLKKHHRIVVCEVEEYRCVACAAYFDNLAEYEQHKLKAWLEGKCA